MNYFRGFRRERRTTRLCNRQIGKFDLDDQAHAVNNSQFFNACILIFSVKFNDLIWFGQRFSFTLYYTFSSLISREIKRRFVQHFYNLILKFADTRRSAENYNGGKNKKKSDIEQQLFHKHRLFVTYFGKHNHKTLYHRSAVLQLLLSISSS